MILYYKIRQILLQNATAALLQNTIKVYYKMRQVFHYKIRQFYYNLRQLLQIPIFIAKRVSTCYDECDNKWFYWCAFYSLIIMDSPQPISTR